MAKFYLADTVNVGTTKHFAGELVDSALTSVAVLQANGAVLIPDSVAGVATAAALVTSMRLRGANEQECSAIMTAFASGHSATATPPKMATIPGAMLPAKAVTMHAQAAAGAALNLTSGFTNPLPRRNMQIVRQAAGPANVSYTITGNAPDGTVVSEVVVAASGATTQGTLAMEVTSVTTTVDPGGTSDFQTGDLFSVGEAMSAAPVVAVDSVPNTLLASDLVTGTVSATTIPNGTRTYSVKYAPPHFHTV